MSILYKNSSGVVPLIPNMNNIDDTTVSASTTYSSSKIEQINTEYPIADTTTGINPTITDSADGYVQSITIYGRTDTVEGELRGIGEDGEVDVVTRGKNLISGYTANMSIDGNGAETANAGALISNKINVKTGVNYVLSGIKETSLIVAHGFDSNNTYLDYIQINTGSAFVPSDNLPGVAQIVIQWNQWNEGSILPINGQLEAGSTPTTYEPYKTPTSAEVSTGIPLYSVGDVKDELKEKKGVVVKRCGKKSLDNLEWTLASLNRWASYISDIKPIAANTDIVNVISDYTAVSANALIADETLNGIALNTDGNILVRNGSTTNPPTGDIVYELAEPYEIPLSASELAQLRNLRTYSGTTNLTITDDPEFTADYLKNTENGQAVADLQTELQKQISYYVAGQAKQNAILNHTYEGEALTDLFATEIQSDYDNAWQWLAARNKSGNWNGMNVADFIPFTTSNNVTLNGQIAGINMYKNYGDIPVGNHVDIICKELWPTIHSVNKVNYNNGTADQQYPWLASDAYHWVNSLAGKVPNGTGLNPETVEVDYTTDGIYYYLPQALKNVIIEKRFLLPTRYSASELLSDDNSWGWVNIGKLWFPDEVEVYGMPVWRGKGGHSLSGSALQYPLFAGNMNRLKFRNGNRYYWGLLSPCSGDSTSWCLSGSGGSCSYTNASAPGIAEPVCFRVGTEYTA